MVKPKTHVKAAVKGKAKTGISSEADIGRPIEKTGAAEKRNQTTQ